MLEGLKSLIKNLRGFLAVEETSPASFFRSTASFYISRAQIFFNKLLSPVMILCNFSRLTKPVVKQNTYI